MARTKKSKPSQKRARGLDEDPAGGQQRKKSKGERTAERRDQASFLNEEEQLATYYPIPAKPRNPPSAAFLASLHDELLSYSESHQPTAAMTSARWAIIHSVRDVARALFGPEAEAVPFGSFVTGLYVADSDIDVVLLQVKAPKSQISSLLSKLGANLRNKGIARDVTIIPGARIPLLKYIDVASDIHVDISVGVIEGVQSAALMKKQSQRYVTFRPLTLFLKAFMAAIDLNDVFKGGISSYILQVMILFHIQVQDALYRAAQMSQGQADDSSSQTLQFSSAYSASKPMPPTMNLGYQLFTFFELFGFTWNYEKYGMRIHDLKKAAVSTGISGNAAPSGVNGSLDCYLKTSENRFIVDRPWSLSIEDPITKTRDIGGACRANRCIQRCFAAAREFLATEPKDPNAKLIPQTKSTPAKSSNSMFAIDTVGDHGTPAAAAASPSPVAASSSSSTSASVDSTSTSFTSSFGFLLSSLLGLPVRYTIADLRRAAVKQPAWNSIVAKLERLEQIKHRNEQKMARKEMKEKKKLKVKTHVDLTTGTTNTASKSARSSTASSSTPTSAAVASTSTGALAAVAPSLTTDVSDVEDEEEEDDESDVEIIDGFGTANQPISIDDFSSNDEAQDDEEDDDEEEKVQEETRNNHTTSSASSAQPTAFSSSSSSISILPQVDVEMSDAPPVVAAAAAAASSSSSSAIPILPAASIQQQLHSTIGSPRTRSSPIASVEQPASGTIDGDALLEQDQRDENMELNLNM